MNLKLAAATLAFALLAAPRPAAALEVDGTYNGIRYARLGTGFTASLDERLTRCLKGHKEQAGDDTPVGDKISATDVSVKYLHSRSDLREALHASATLDVAASFGSIDAAASETKQFTYSASSVYYSVFFFKELPGISFEMDTSKGEGFERPLDYDGKPLSGPALKNRCGVYYLKRKRRIQSVAIVVEIRTSSSLRAEKVEAQMASHWGTVTSEAQATATLGQMRSEYAETASASARAFLRGGTDNDLATTMVEQPDNIWALKKAVAGHINRLLDDYQQQKDDLVAQLRLVEIDASSVKDLALETVLEAQAGQTYDYVAVLAPMSEFTLETDSADYLVSKGAALTSAMEHYERGEAVRDELLDLVNNYAIWERYAVYPEKLYKNASLAGDWQKYVSDQFRKIRACLKSGTDKDCDDARLNDPRGVLKEKFPSPLDLKPRLQLICSTLTFNRTESKPLSDQTIVLSAKLKSTAARARDLLEARWMLGPVPAKDWRPVEVLDEEEGVIGYSGNTGPHADQEQVRSFETLQVKDSLGLVSSEFVGRGEYIENDMRVTPIYEGVHQCATAGVN